jgi:hypothetical protein
MKDRDAEAIVWSMFYAGLCSFLMHPGSKKVELGKSLKAELDFCAELADTMYERFARRFKSEFYHG